MGRPIGELAREWGCDPSNATFIVDRLEKAGLAGRSPLASDRHVKLVVLTAAGAATRLELEAEYHRPPPEILALPGKDLKALARILGKARRSADEASDLTIDCSAPSRQEKDVNAPDPPEALMPADRHETHVVLNQARTLAGHNAFSDDIVLTAAIEREAPWAADRCAALGALAGDEQVEELARLANRHVPELKTHDRFGNRIDWVEFHPSWHQLMATAWRHEVHSPGWRKDVAQPHFARAVLSYLWNQVEHGSGCPTGMAYASHAGFAAEPALSLWAERVLGTEYEFSRREVADKPSVVIGYAMTEKQGGSDLRETQNQRPCFPTATPTTVRRRTGTSCVATSGSARCRCPTASSPWPGPPGRDVLLPAAHPAGRQLQPLPDPAPEGQVRQQVQRLERNRVLRDARDQGGRRGQGDPRDPHSRAPDPPRLCGRLGRIDAPGPDPGPDAHQHAAGVRRALRTSR